MRSFRWLSVRAVVVALVLASASRSNALQTRQEASRFDRIAIPDPSVMVSPAAMPIDTAPLTEAYRSGWAAFKSVHGKLWDITIDARSGVPLLVQGEGISLIPGSGNSIRSAAPVTLDSLAATLRSFVTANFSLAAVADDELALNREGSGALTPELWKVVFDRSVAGVPVVGDRWVFHVGHGNLIAFGATRWSAITTSSLPYVSVDDARAVFLRYMGVSRLDRPTIEEAGSLWFVPRAAAGTEVDSFAGAVGSGYETALAWRFALTVPGEPGKWTGYVDAHTGTVLALTDTIRYAQAKGGVLPLSNDGACPDGCEQAGFPIPFADIKIGSANSSSASMGSFSCAPGGATATTTLAGPYVRVVDSCGAISQSITCDEDLDLKTSIATDCSVPVGASPGDTRSARSSFYHLNRIKEHGRAWLPTNTWLTLQLRDNVNLPMSCNAFWNDAGLNGTVNFYRSGGGCRNTGEIAAIFLHEWGHGLDQNDGGGYDNPSEAYADVSSFMLTHKSCIGRGFLSSNCGGYGNACLSCTGVRDQDWEQRAAHAPQTPETWPGSCPSGGGPCGKEEHCEAYLAGETIWDLAVRDLPASGLDAQTAWQIADRLWFKSRTGSGGNAYTCGAPTSSRSCAASSWFTELRTVDDDDGNLANGTPHAAAIYAAFARHNIPCGAASDAANQNQTSCPALARPTLTQSASFGQVALSWTSVAGASSYNVLRNDQGCGWGFTIVANVAGTTYTDTSLPSGFSLYYAIQPVGANTSCVGLTSTCAAVQANGAHARVGSTARVADTCASGGAGDDDSTYDAGEQIQFSITLRNDGGPVLTGVTATLTPTTPGVTMVAATASYGTIGSGASVTSPAPYFAVQLPASLGCNSTIAYDLTIHANEGAWVSSFTQAVGRIVPGGGTLLSENFAGGIPATWTVVNAGVGGGAAATWTATNPGARGFSMPMVAPVAMVDSNNAGAAATQDEQLITPALDATTAVTAKLDFDEYFRWKSGGMAERGDVDVSSSATAGAWVNVLRNQNASSPPIGGGIASIHRSLDISPQAAGATNVRVRFHYYSAQNEWWWELDNVVISYATAGTCATNDCAAASADLTLSSSCPATVPAGQDVACTVTITNNGPDAALNAQLDDAIPTHTTFRSLQAAAGWSCSTPQVGAAGAIACSASSLLSGAPAGFTLVLRADSCAGDGTTVTNTATASSATSDPSVANNSAFTTTTLSDTGACDDGDACTSADACQDGQCAGVAAGPPAEVEQLRFSSKTLREWDAVTVVGPTAVYDVVRGLVAQWPVGSGATEQCVAAGIAGTQLDLPDAPDASGAFWYLVRSRNPCGVGTYGVASSGAERVATVCP